MKIDFSRIIPRSPAEVLQEELEAFIDRHMAKLLPPYVYRCVKKGKHLAKMHKYLMRHGITLVKDDLKLSIFKKGKHIATFHPKATTQMVASAVPRFIKRY